MKAKFGYQAYECRPTGEFRHLTIEVFALSEYDLADGMLRAAQRMDSKRVERLSQLASKLDNRPVFTSDSMATITWQADPTNERWYAPSLNLGFSHDQGATESVFKAWKKTSGNITPKSLIESLQAVQIEAVRDESGNRLYIGGADAYMIADGHSPKLDDPYPKTTEAAA